MFKRIAWICAAVLLLLPSVSNAHKTDISGIEGTFQLPETGHAQDRDLAPNEQLNRDVRILRTNNKAQINRYVPKVYSLRNVNPFAVIRFVSRVVAAEEGAIFTFVSPDGFGGRILIAVPEYQIDHIDQLIKVIDKPGLTSSSGSKRIYRQLKHRRANISANPQLDDTAFIQSFAIYLTTNGSEIIVDPEQNAIFIEDAPSGSDYLDAALFSTLDKPTAMAVLSAKVWELDMTNNARIGLDYMAWKNGPGASLFAFGAFTEAGRLGLRNGSPQNLGTTNGMGRGDFDAQGYNFAYRYEFHSAYFDFLATRGKAKILTQAKVAALNTRPATITAGDQILFYPINTTDPSGVRSPQLILNGSAIQSDAFQANQGRSLLATAPTSSTSGTALDPDLTTRLISDPNQQQARFVQADLNVSTGVQMSAVDTGLKVSLTPIIYENGLDVNIVGVFNDYNGFDSLGQPNISSRRFENAVRLSEGQEIVLGGLMREESIKNAPKAPFFGSLPIIGWFFGGETSRRKQSQVVMALKAEDIVHFNGDDYGISDEDQAVINQADGSTPIAVPETTWGFDMSAIDKTKEPYAFLLDKDHALE